MSNMALMMDILPSTARGKAMGVFQDFEFVGSFIGTPVGAVLATYTSHADVFYFTAFFMLVSFAIAYMSKDIRSIKNESKGETRLSLIVCLCNLFRMFSRQGIYQTYSSALPQPGFRV